ncbi:MAG: tRNA (adenosine(37)-N6)-threonylcarbamoyltransferase complex transferase subunit TsaD [Candidatus Marinimicrobia bacterium]|nr:tRNA (adenosine(37)-N6)-threonylcarbamoyltransferase complex transferase subunit TsaD [Candidatus Neomarinimicrobiota bacterium]MCF7828567.1 tRNA (adenosine(37)-N6)-threonylcarbamoyltransferase complex transferase subunit TsaD [Candidatus Neomarinimicrobiota bacterium]MCF7880308.1 tRNA (adenosine(37)-N6)-threonylcarbamoyltransferase complex transferase subunit TsaD [Candidatus Neomarinimicrobiota bacterium]
MSDKTVGTVLGIETSCDETSVGIVRDGKVLSNIIASQQVHSEYGGVVPEMASREHERLLAHITREACDDAHLRFTDIDGIAVTAGPGLMGSLLVGINFAKGLVLRNSLPFIGINHIEAHLLANFIEAETLEYPFLCLLVSGGHSQIIRVNGYDKYDILGTTMDDAAGEAFDKVARLLDLGYPGGPYIQKQSEGGQSDKYDFPRGLLDSGDLNFSFSGLKTAVLYTVKPMEVKKRTAERPHISASFQAAVVESLVAKMEMAIEQTGITQVTLAGGVAANAELRRQMDELRDRHGLNLYYPSLEYCTDNGAMIAYAGWEGFRHDKSSELDLTATPRVSISSPVFTS